MSTHLEALSIYETFSMDLSIPAGSNPFQFQRIPFDSDSNYGSIPFDSNPNPNRFRSIPIPTNPIRFQF
ncbi:unnamed protein product [Adineta ricciae]|uniref:Uncharacterized protein n=1 Tax=Adineta ricciae TaxID=249248 RepID=A0A816DCP9_ADIRI|nr:unnamed protein product [Adineta ricciae]